MKYLIVWNDGRKSFENEAALIAWIGEHDEFVGCHGMRNDLKVYELNEVEDVDEFFLAIEA
jgi:hypothetical protein